MIVEIEVVERPSSCVTTLFKKINPEIIKETKTVRIKSDSITKTRVDTSLFVDGAMLGLNLALPNFKTAEVTEHNFFSGEWTTRHYFKLLKSQDFDRYKDYVVEAVKFALIQLGIRLDKIRIELEEPKWLNK